MKKLVGLNIRRRREKLDMSRELLAEKVGASHQYVAKCELGRQNLTIESMAKFANALDVKVNDLLEKKLV